MRISRLAFLAIVAGVLLPSPPPDDPLVQRTAAEDPRRMAGADATEMALAAMATASDVSSFCQRQPVTCDVAGRVWANFKLRVRYSIRLVYEWAAGAEGRRPAAGSERPALRPAVNDTGAMAPVTTSPVREVRPPADTSRPSRGADGIITGSTRRIVLNRSQEAPRGSENTLTIEDILVPWNGPRDG